MQHKHNTPRAQQSWKTIRHTVLCIFTLFLSLLFATQAFADTAKGSANCALKTPGFHTIESIEDFVTAMRVYEKQNKLSRANLRKLAKLFTQTDQNHDGKLVSAELSNMVPHLSATYCK